MITVLFFAKLREDLDCESLQVEHDSGIQTIRDIIARIHDHHGQAFAEKISAEGIVTAVNQVIVKNNVLVSDGDEIAFFPPVSGG